MSCLIADGVQSRNQQIFVANSCHYWLDVLAARQADRQTDRQTDRHAGKHVSSLMDRRTNTLT